MAVTIELKSLDFGYRQSALLFQDTSLTLVPSAPEGCRGFVSVIMGASGCGKTTLLKLLLREETPSHGEIVICPSDARLSYLSQDPVLFEHLSILENARYFSKLASTRQYFAEAVFKRAAEELGLVDLLERKSSVTALSGGERQRIALLRAISIRPSLMLLDEPCRGLDPAVRQEFLMYLRRLADELSLSVIYVTHQQSEARFIADRVFFFVRSSGSGKAHIVEGTLQAIITFPPHEAVAQTFSVVPMNRTAVSVTGVHLSAFDRRFGISRSQCSKLAANTDAIMLFSATQVKWNCDNGVICRRTSASGQYLLASCVNDGARPSTVVGSNTDEEVYSFEIVDEVLLFSLDGEFLDRCHITIERR